MCVLHWPVHGLRESYFVSRNLLHDVLWLRGPLLTVVLSPQHRKMIGCFYEQIGFQHIPQNVVFCIFSRTALLSMDFGPGHGFRSNGTRGSLLDVQRSICGTTWSMLSASQLQVQRQFRLPRATFPQVLIATVCRLHCFECMTQFVFTVPAVCTASLVLQQWVVFTVSTVSTTSSSIATVCRPFDCSDFCTSFQRWQQCVVFNVSNVCRSSSGISTLCRIHCTDCVYNFFRFGNSESSYLEGLVQYAGVGQCRCVGPLSAPWASSASESSSRYVIHILHNQYVVVVHWYTFVQHLLEVKNATTENPNSVGLEAFLNPFSYFIYNYVP